MSDESTRLSKDVETRKVQRLGSSSLFITLPKKWINRWNIKPGDKIIMEISEDGTLRLVAEKIKLNMSKRSIKVDVDNYKQPIVTAIPCLYALGYDEIVFSSKKNLEPKETEEAINFSKQLVGIEITEVSQDKIRLDCLLDTEKIGVESLLRRILNIVSRKVDDIIALLKGQQQDSQANVEDLRRVYLMLLRRSMGGRYSSEKDTLRNFIIAINSSTLLRIYYIMQKIYEIVKKDDKLKNDQENIRKLIDIFQKINDLFDEIIMSILFPSVKRISNGYTLISQVRQLFTELSISNQLILSYLDDLFTMLEDALHTSSCSLFLEEVPWIERNLNSQ